MNLERFLREGSERWDELDRLVARAGRRAERLGPDGVRTLGARYREAAADLALARRRFPGDPVVDRLERTVAGARTLVYEGGGRRASLRWFATRGYWRAVAERPRALAASWALLLVPAALAWLWASSDPAGALGLVPGALQGAADPPAGGRGLSGELAAAFSTQVLVNNVQVTILAFALGLTAGLGTALVVASNGVILGAVGGLAAGSGALRPFVDLVTPHGVLELSCVVVAGAAGLRLGWALVEPGPRTRGEALQAEGRRTVLVVLGTAPWLAVCALVEGFAQPAALGLGGVLAVGFGLAAVYWGLVAWRGRPDAPATPAPGASR
jgi:uncharacterized membrane protein SpoIIM required for sporulation